MKHTKQCWCYDQEHPEIHNTGMDNKLSKCIHFTCKKCKAHCIISKAQEMTIIGMLLCHYCREGNK